MGCLKDLTEGEGVVVSGCVGSMMSGYKPTILLCILAFKALWPFPRHSCVSPDLDTAAEHL